jgi:hypothetical protein
MNFLFRSLLLTALTSIKSWEEARITKKHSIAILNRNCHCVVCYFLLYMRNLTLHASILSMLSDVIFINFHSTVTLFYFISYNSVVITDWMPQFAHFLWKRLFHGGLTSVTENLYNTLILVYVTMDMEIIQRWCFPAVQIRLTSGTYFMYYSLLGKVKVKISLLQAVEVPRVARGQGSHIT